MPVLSEADRLLLDGVRRGDADAWRQLVDAYQGRLVAFARSRCADPASAEDLVQECFLAFLQHLHRYRGDAGLETYLFTILRRRIIDQLRGRRLPDPLSAAAAEVLPGRDPSPSFYARNDEETVLNQSRLVSALQTLVAGLQDEQRFDDLLVLDLIFTSDDRNKDIAARASVPRPRVAVVKHRAFKRLQALMQESHDARNTSPAALPDNQTLAGLWRDYRLGCPKRSTIGGYLLGTLDAPWQRYTQAHLDAAECPTCRASLDDLQSQTDAADRETLRDRILNSTVGFMTRPG